MRIGILDERIRIDVRGAAQDDGYGTHEGDWTSVGIFSAEVQDVVPSRAESAAGGVNVTMGPARVRMRYTTKVRSHMRLVRLDRGNVPMEIVTEPAEIGRKEMIEFMAQRYST